MTKCPNCGGGVRFDIATQRMKCDYCSGQFEPYDDAFGSIAEAQEDFDVTVFTCGNCGGEIVSTEETGASFCSFCGSSIVLEGRLSKEKRPEMIIPFKLTKEGCKEAFFKRLGKAIFTPKAYKESAKVDGFRGIYMPYWVYDMSQEGRVMVKTSTSKRRGDYIITDHFEMSGIMDNAYDGVSYDASSSFADDISTEIAPYNVKDIKQFSPSFLAGFYADIADVPEQVYEETAIDLAKESTYNFLKKNSPMAKNSFDEPKEKIKSKINTKIYGRHSAMFPVWFLSYRSRDRVAYATVNGQTGRVSADMPVSIPKYFLCALIIAVAIFALLQLFLTVTPDVLLIAIALTSLISAGLYKAEMKKIVAKEQYDNDLGMQDLFARKKKARLEAQKGASFQSVGETEPYTLTENDIKKSKVKLKTGGSGSPIAAIVVGVIIGSVLLSVGSSLISMIGIDKICGFIGLISLMICGLLTASSNKDIKQMKGKKGLPKSLWTCIGLLIITAVSFWDPPQDAIYYGAAILAIICVIVNIIDLMASYNYIAMRPLPQFETHSGGDDRA